MKTWAQVSEHPQFTALSAAEQDEARKQYFAEVVAPRLPADELEAARAQFDADTRIRKQDLPASVAQSEAGAGRGSVNPPPAVRPPRRGGTRGEFHPYVAGDERIVKPGQFMVNGRIYGHPTADRPEGSVLGADDGSVRPGVPEMRPSPEPSVIGSALRHLDRKPLDQSVFGAAKETVGDAARGLAKVGPGLATSLWGGVQAAADVAGADRLSGLARESAGAGREHLAQLDNPNGDRLVTGAFQSLGTALAGGAVAGTRGAIGAAVGQTAGDKYSELRRDGFDVLIALEGATVHGIAEYMGERIGMPSLGRMVSGLAAKTGMKPSEVLREALKQQGEEQVTLAMQDLYDKFGRGGTRANMTFDDYFNDVVDTAKQTAIMTAVAAGGGAAMRAAPAPRVDPHALIADAINEAAHEYGLSTKAAVALRDAALERPGNQGVEMAARAMDEFERVGMTKKPGAKTGFLSTLQQKVDEAAQAAAQREERPAEAQSAPEPTAEPPTVTTDPSIEQQLQQDLAQQLGIADDGAARDGLEPAAPVAEIAEPAAEPAPVDAAAHEAATSPQNDRPEPTEAQKQAGNYRLGHTRIAGLNISIENPQGSERSGTDADGKPWAVRKNDHYGYIRSTVGKDGDHIDTFVKAGTPEDYDGGVLVIDQKSPNGRFDEHKVMIGYDDARQAIEAYRSNYAPGWDGVMSWHALDMPNFKAWLATGNHNQPAAKWKPNDISDVADASHAPAGRGDERSPAVARSGGDPRPVADERRVDRRADAPAGRSLSVEPVPVGDRSDDALSQHLRQFGYTDADLAGMTRQQIKDASGSLSLLMKQRERDATAHGHDPAEWAERRDVERELETVAPAIVAPAGGLRIPAQRVARGVSAYDARTLQAADKETMEWAESEGLTRAEAIDSLRREIAEGRVKDENGVYFEDLITFMDGQRRRPDSVEDRRDAALSGDQQFKPLPSLTGKDLTGLDYDELDGMHQRAIDHNKAVSIAGIRRFFGEAQAKEVEGWSLRKIDRWLSDNETDEASDWMQARYINEDIIKDFRSAVNDFDVENAGMLGRSIALKARRVDDPGFFETPEGATVQNALRYARQQGWSLDDVLDGMRARAVGWAGDNAPELFKRMFTAAPTKPAQQAPQPAIAGKREALPAPGPRILGNVGTTPATATPLELRSNSDGTLTPWHEGHELLDFDSGNPLKLPAGATDQEALDAIKTAGSLGRHTKVFKEHDGRATKTAVATDKDVAGQKTMPRQSGDSNTGAASAFRWTRQDDGSFRVDELPPADERASGGPTHLGWAKFDASGNLVKTGDDWVTQPTEASLEKAKAEAAHLADLWAKNKPRPFFFRFGRPPVSGRSRNAVDGSKEKGVSVYAAVPDAWGRMHFDDSIGLPANLGVLLLEGRPVYEVEGEAIGTGYDGEPLLKSPKVVRQIPRSEVLKLIGAGTNEQGASQSGGAAASAARSKEHDEPSSSPRTPQAQADQAGAQATGVEQTGIAGEAGVPAAGAAGAEAAGVGGPLLSRAPQIGRGKIGDMPADMNAPGQNADGSGADSRRTAPIDEEKRASALDEARWFDRGLKLTNTQRLYRGTSERTGRNTANFGRGLYVTTDKSEAAQYGVVNEMSRADLPQNPLRFTDEGKFREWESFVSREVFGFRRISELESKWVPDQWIRMLDPSVDGVQIGTGHGAFFVRFPNEPRAPESPGASADITLKRGAARTGMTLADAQQTAKQLMDVGVRKIHVVDTVHDMPPARRDMILAKAENGEARGAYFPTEDEVWLVAANLRNGGELVDVVLHESFHRGLHVTFGADGAKLLRQIYATNKRIRDLADGYMAEYKIGKEEAVNEALADLASKGEARSLRGWQSLLKMIRDWLGKIADALGIELKFTDEMVEDLIAGMTRIGLRDQPAVNVDTKTAQREATTKAINERVQAGESFAEAATAVALSRAAAAPPPAATAAGAGSQTTSQPTQLPKETAFRAAQRMLQDNLNRFTVLRDWLKEQGVKLTDTSNVWEFEERMHGRIATRTEDFREKVVKPIVKEVTKAGFTMEQVAEYLHAQHAEERNQQIEKIDPSNKEGAGMSTAAAQSILAKADPELAKLANKLQAVTNDTRQILLDAGIITKEMADAWQAAYKHYVPLKGEGDPPAQTGKALSVNGRQKRAMGHSAREEFIVENILRDHERAIALAEKNTVGHSLLKFVMEAGDDRIATISRPEKRKVLAHGSPSFEVVDPAGAALQSFDKMDDALQFVRSSAVNGVPGAGTLRIRQVNGDPLVKYMARPQLADNEAQVYVNGHAVRVQLNDELLARAYLKMGVEGISRLFRVNREINRFLSKVYTSANPEFLPVNVVRDLYAGTINITGKYGAGIAAKSLAKYPVAFAQMLAYSYTGKAAPMVEEYRKAGGSTGAAWLADTERISKDVDKAYQDYKGWIAAAKEGRGLRAGRIFARKMIGGMASLFEHLNAAGENAMRVAVFQAVKDTPGMTVNDAASAAKNSTINFNRKGELTQALGGFYLFFNPAVQGAANMIDTLAQGKHREQAWAVLAASAALAYYLRSAQWEDEEGRKLWRRIPQHQKDRNIIIRRGNDNWLMVPLPYDYGFFFTLGNHLYDLAHGGDVAQTSLRVALSLYTSVSPINPFAGEDPSTTGAVELVPGVFGGELFRDVVRLAANRDGLGRQIVPDSKFDKGKPDSQRMNRNTKGSAYDKVAGGLNSATGGSQTQAGAVDVSPETLKFWTNALTGGLGRTIVDTVSLGKRAHDYASASTEAERDASKPTLSDIPIVRRFAGEDSPRAARGAFWEAAKKVESTMADFARAQKAGDKQGLTLLEKRKQLAALGEMLKTSKELAEQARDQADVIMADQAKSDAYKRAAVKAVERKETEVYDKFLDAFDIVNRSKDPAQGKPAAAAAPAR